VSSLRGLTHASVKDAVLLVPDQHVAHWRRFHVIPTALVRDIAYSLKRQQLVAHGGVKPSTVEADSMAYAERFLRAIGESDDG
jgi:hypothetical protein